MNLALFLNETFRYQMMISGSDECAVKVNCKFCPLYYAVVKDWGGGFVLSLSLSVAAADNTTAAGGKAARPYITTCTNSLRERRVGAAG